VYCSAGDGTTSEGEFWEALNSASNLKLPVLFLIEDNGYAISVPVEVQTAGGSVSKLVSNFPNLMIEECDGTDPIAAYAACKRAVDYIRAGKGPALVHGHVIRPYSHSLSDDEKLYRPESEREKDAKRDPVSRLQMFLVRENILDEAGVNSLEKSVDEEVQAAADRALAAAFPATDSVYRHVSSEDLAPRTLARDPQTQGARKTMSDLIDAWLKAETRRVEGIVVLDGGVADGSSEDYLEEKKMTGKVGVSKLSAGLQCEFGGERVCNSPLAEANIV